MRARTTGMSGARARRLVAVAATGATIATLAVATPVANAETAAPAALLSGQVLSAGRAVPGASITLTAWPNSAYLSAQKNGDPVPTKVISTATTASSGTYSLSPDLATLPAMYKEPDGTVNLTEDTVQGTTSTQYNLAAAVPGSPAAVDRDHAVTGARPSSTSFDLAASTVTSGLGSAAATVAHNDVETPSTLVQAAGAATQPGQAMVPQSGGVAPPPYTGCNPNWTASTIYPNRAEEFLRLYTYDDATVTQALGSTHAMGIGVAVTGGSWSASGSASIEKTTSSSASVTYGDGDKALFNEVNYRHYYVLCHTGDKSFYRHQVRPIGLSFFQVESLTRAIPHYNWTYCALYTHGDFTKSTGSNETFSAGVSAPYINLSAHVSYSKSTEVTWHVNSSPEKICGSSSLGFAPSPRAGGRQSAPYCTSNCPSAVEPKSR